MISKTSIFRYSLIEPICGIQMWLSRSTKKKDLFELSCRYQALKEVEYCKTYELLFEKMRQNVGAVLELGINTGGSLLMWREYFPNAKILGVDIKACESLRCEERISTLQAEQTDIASIGKFLKENNVELLDIIIDDAAHIGHLAKNSFWGLFDAYLHNGGYYIIEDWGTGYWPEWPDGQPYSEPDTSREASEGYFPNHVAGMVGFVKQLVDEAHRYAIKDDPNRRRSKFQSMVVKEAMAIVQKR